MVNRVNVMSLMILPTHCVKQRKIDGILYTALGAQLNPTTYYLFLFFLVFMVILG